LRQFGVEETLGALGVLGIDLSRFATAIPIGLTSLPQLLFAVTTTLEECNKKEIGEVADETKIRVQVKLSENHVDDEVCLVNEAGETKYTWKWSGDGANNGGSWIGNWKGKIYLHYKNSNRRRTTVTYEVKFAGED
jgi:hypothetical protein